MEATIQRDPSQWHQRLLLKGRRPQRISGPPLPGRRNAGRPSPPRPPIGLREECPFPKEALQERNLLWRRRKRIVAKVSPLCSYFYSLYFIFSFPSSFLSSPSSPQSSYFPSHISLLFTCPSFHSSLYPFSFLFVSSSALSSSPSTCYLNFLLFFSYSSDFKHFFHPPCFALISFWFDLIFIII